MRPPRHGFVIGLAALALLGAGPEPPRDRAAPGPAKAELSPSARDARALAATIDRRLAEGWEKAHITPAGPADDAEYLRRVTLDLVGKIPTAAEARAFLDDADPDKRAKLVERLLDGPAYVARATELWRQLLLPEADTEDRARQAAPTFEAWLRRKVAEGVGYDRMAREVLTARLGARAATPPGGRAEPSAQAFYVAKDGKPENLAASTARVFLGVRLECAECHNHPFAKWKREEFWGLAAFFAGVQKQGPADGFGAIRESAGGRRELTIPGSERVVKASFPAGESPPDWKPRANPREVLADWVTSPANPYFARAAANRVWARFFGTGLVDPVDDMGGDNVPTHPELLDELARQFVAHQYDLKFLIRAIAASRAYGLTSAVARPQPSPPDQFSAMAVRGLSAGQLLNSLEIATGFRSGPPGMMAYDGGARGRFLELFTARDEQPTEAQTSILQALTLMNGRIVADATDLRSGDTLASIAEAPYLDTAGRVEELFLAALTRRPTPRERAYLAAHVDAASGADGKAEALADVFWALLNGPEFKHNH